MGAHAREGGEGGVSSVVGTILMLAVTVSVFGGLSIVVLAEIRSSDPPPDAELAFVSDGDRAILTHRGGEAIRLDDGFLLLNVAGTEIRYDLTAVADQTADGRTWRIGETICLSGPNPPDPARPCLVDDLPILGVAVVAGGGLLADEGERGGEAGPCPLDNVAPVVTTPLSLVPTDLLTTTTGAVTVTLTATDDCSGVDDAVAPLLFYRINDGSDPAFIPLGGMTSLAPTTPATWTGTVPAQSWNLLGGKTLDMYASGVQDAKGNQAGATAIQSELVVVVILETYVSLATPTMGTAGPLGPAQDAADSEAAMTLTEGGTTTPAGSGGPTKFSGTTAATTGGISAGNALASDDVRGEIDAAGDWIEVSGFTLPSNAATVTSITLGYEGMKDGAGGSDPVVRLDYKIGPTGSWVNGPSTITENGAADTMRASTPSGSFSVNDVQSMVVRIFLFTDAGTKDVLVDHLFVTVAYTTSAVTTYSLDMRLDFAGTSDGSSETLELRYKTSGDTYRLFVWDSGTSAYTERGTLSSASFTTFTWTLTSGEFNGGAPRIQLIDATPTGATPGTIDIDYARVVTT